MQTNGKEPPQDHRVLYRLQMLFITKFICVGRRSRKKTENIRKKLKRRGEVKQI